MRHDVYKSLIIFFKAFHAFELLIEEEYIIIVCIHKAFIEKHIQQRRVLLYF